MAQLNGEGGMRSAGSGRFGSGGVNRAPASSASVQRQGSYPTMGVPSSSAGMQQQGSYGAMGADGDASQGGASAEVMNALQRLQGSAGFGSGLMGGNSQQGSIAGLAQYGQQGSLPNPFPGAGQMQARNSALPSHPPLLSAPETPAGRRALLCRLRELPPVRKAVKVLRCEPC